MPFVLSLTNVVFRLSLFLLAFKLSLYLVRILYFVEVWIIIRLHQSTPTHSMTCQALLLCKYQIISIFPCCNLQNMNIFSQWSFFIFSNYMWDVIIKKVVKPWWSTISSISTNPPLSSKSLTTIKTTTYNVGIPGTGSRRARMFFCWYKWHGWPSLFTLSFHNIYNFCYLKNNWYKASECQHKIQEHCLILTYSL